VDTLDEASGKVKVIIEIFGRPTEVELEHWQVEKA
jgi:transcriptional antiterminator NusG